MKHKHILIAVAVFIAAGLSTTAFIVANPLKSSTKTNPKLGAMAIPSKSYLDDLKDAGFVSLPDFVKKDAEEKRAYYKELYGVLFHSDDEMKTLLEDNGWLMGGSDIYVGEIPLKEGRIMIERLKMISDKEPKLDRMDTRNKEFLNQKDAQMRWEASGRYFDVSVLPLVFIAAPKEKFNLNKDKLQINPDNTITAKNNDPVALYKIKGGWLELARW